MKRCPNCDQRLAEGIISCPSCGSRVSEGIKSIDDYRIIEVLHEGATAILCRATKADADVPVMVRIFTPQAGIDDDIARRLTTELEQLHRLPQDYFVKHLEIRKSSDGLWYRVSEWLDVENWGSLIAAGVFQDYDVAFQLFGQIAAILEGLHQIGHFIPHLIFDDILVVRDGDGAFRVKIDYKLSRFLNPQLDHLSPKLQGLLTSHPDIIHERPLDFRSDIWSLGKLFVEVLTAQHDATDLMAAIDAVPLPPQVTVLLKSMLADDPDLRPQSMAEVADVFSHLTPDEIESAMCRCRELSEQFALEISGRSKRRLRSFMVAGPVVVLAVLALWFFYFRPGDTEINFEKYVNRYAESVAFVVTEYWITAGENRVYRNYTEGSAFLVDSDGYLLTNRHVVCPWLEDSQLFMWLQQLAARPAPIQLDYRIFLWFEGQRAFKRLPEMSQSNELADIYRVSSAFRSDGQPHLTIAGAARSPEQTWQLIRAPLKDDFAVLKIDQVPEGLHPLVLDEKMESAAIPKLSPVIALGFPLGSRSQEATVNASVTQGYVRRAFENLLQVDAPFHQGNSGGPVIDGRGKVIGIASGVAMDWISAPIPIPTQLSDMGMVQPINKAVDFLNEIRAGKVKWNGVLDLSVKTKIQSLIDLAEKGAWSEARSLADQELDASQDPTLVLAAAMIHFCAGDHQRAADLYSRVLSMDDQKNDARLMLYIIDWIAGQSSRSLYGRDLLALDWRSPYEFYRFLVQALEEEIPQSALLKAGFTETEQHWLRYVAALVAEKNQTDSQLEELLQPAVLGTERENWLHILSLALLQKIQADTLKQIEDPQRRAAYTAQLDQFAQAYTQSRSVLAQRRAVQAPLLAQLGEESLGPGDKRGLVQRLLDSGPVNGELLVDMVYYCTMEDDWADAMDHLQRYLALDGRENAGRLQMGLLKAEILLSMGREEEALAQLEGYLQETTDPWYRYVAGCLLGREKEQVFEIKAGDSPEYLLTGHVALGFWAEGKGDKQKAIDHYREALGSYMDHMIEYAFALQRIKRLRKAS